MRPEPESSPAGGNETIEGTLQQALEVDGEQAAPSKHFLKRYP